MFKGAWILPLVMVLVLLPALAMAQDRAPVFKDLPGVVPEKSRVTVDNGPDESPRCESGTAYMRHHDSLRGGAFGRGFPTHVYRCESKGFTYTGTDMPPNRPWVPGLNPQFLPEN
ncbi:hypothetical protein J2T09_003327 [Neorhizobium huautlense]|uniref:Transmembrane protein n=1 Tax=Neorhizobium huautlense TaxID=67774 RepID=A0ABT9PVP0_9HYPH|nr:hypothetical protein [Neorhizobium huautlense]MDP9838559.1 hypothetical protein [Neorhizobium huautlense]